MRLCCVVAAAVAATAWGGAAGGPAVVSVPKSNHLLNEKSPYLRQHAFNPVDWYPWGPDAFEKARRENKPIFLSIGYSTCHWCHVMARESFSDPEVARILNDGFVCIKVDREERPDIDRVYMTFVQALTGGGGWPLSVWLTPDLKPFFGGTYFPPDDRDGRPGLKALLGRLASIWASQRERVLQQSDQMLAALAAATKSAAAAALPIADLRNRGFVQLAGSFDEVHGGFGGAPKFPNPAILDFLFDVVATSPDAERRDQAQRMALRTLREIAAGGIHDHIGGGFHRYSTDGQWRVPHFEKMLYDQAQLAGVYLTAWQISADPVFKEAAEDTLGYVRRRLTDPDGGFYSAEDADSEVQQSGKAESGKRPPQHAEGAFYVWTDQEIRSLLDPKSAALFAFAYGVEPKGNVPEEPQGELAGQNVLFRAYTVAECAAKFGLTDEAARSGLDAAVQRLNAAREERPRPQLDDKIITAWNGLAISAFARAAQVLGDDSCRTAAERAASFLQSRLFALDTGRLARSYRAGVRDEQGFAEDYAFLVQGLLDLYETTFDTRWLAWAVQLQEKQNELFYDSEAGGYFANGVGDASVLLRLKQDSDGAEPSPNSIAVRNLVRLAAMLNRAEWHKLAEQTGRAFGAQLDQSPVAMPQMLASLGWLEGTPKEILIQGDAWSPDTSGLIAAVWRRYVPRRVLLRIDGQSRPFFESRVPFVADLPRDPGGTAIAYVCENYVCQLPTRDPATMVQLLTKGSSARVTQP
jgi:uncharacterized protein YyaL (SSP411 family)